MEVTALCFRLLILILLGTRVHNSYAQKSDAAFLRITPNSLQHFQFTSVTFACEGFDGSTQLRGITTTDIFDPDCDIKTPAGSCTILRAYPSDSGQYWCETEGGERSKAVYITITAGPVILESPALPVMEGHKVTLSCRKKMTSSNLTADFYKDGLHVGSRSTGEMIIQSVSKSDEGLYKCRISDVGESAESWLAVRDPRDATSGSTPTIEPALLQTKKGENSLDDSGSHVLSLLWVSVSILMVVLVVLMVGFLHIWKRRVSLKTPTAASRSGEENQMDTADAADNLGLETNHSRQPQEERGDYEFLFQPVYSTLTISATLHTVQDESGLSGSRVNPTAARHPNLSAPEILYSTVQMTSDQKVM